MKYSKIFFLLVASLGIVFLGLVILSSYLMWMDSLNVLARLDLEKIGFPLVLAGMAFLTIGVLGFDWRHVRKSKTRFILYVVLIPLSAFLVFLASSFLVVMNVPMFPLRSEITQVKVIENNPLVLSLNVKALTSRDSRIEGVVITNNDTMVASRVSEPLIINAFWTFTALCELPGGSEIKFTVNFNCTLSSGDYIVLLTSANSNHDSAPFTIAS